MPYWPARDTFDYNIGEDRRGSLNGPILNSFASTPSYGDERAFFDGRPAGGGPGSHADLVDLSGTTEDTVVVRAYVHNNANPSTNESGVGVTKNLRIKITLPSGVAEFQQPHADLTLDNPAEGAPAMVQDTMRIKADRPFSLAPVPGSARLYRKNEAFELSDEIFGAEGALLGHT